MNDLEFREQYKRLTTWAPYFYQDKDKMNSIWEMVKDFSKSWFESLVNRMILANDPRNPLWSISSAVESEHRAKRTLEKTNVIAFGSQEPSTEEGYKRAIGNAGSFWAAVEKSRKGELA